jgi:hypothetical protein
MMVEEPQNCFSSSTCNAVGLFSMPWIIFIFSLIVRFFLFSAMAVDLLDKTKIYKTLMNAMSTKRCGMYFQTVQCMHKDWEEEMTVLCNGPRTAYSAVNGIEQHKAGHKEVKILNTQNFPSVII